LRAAHDVLAGCDLDALTPAELLGVADELETLTCQLPTQRHRILARLQAESTPKEMGRRTDDEPKPTESDPDPPQSDAA
jgi:hypothetical protein